MYKNVSYLSSIEIRSVKTAGQLREYGDYRYLKPSIRARIFNFEIGDSSNNLKLYKAVMTELGIKQELDEQFEDFNLVIFIIMTKLIIDNDKI